MAWIALAVFLIPLIYMLANNGQQKRARLRKLDQIQRRLAQKEAAKDQNEPESESD